ncbi:MAG: hypothetical protein NTX17_03325 [Candidatus Eisenbacteria bacterium]|nr:hypothetical protein [Candidatus Eisenbacteria bacterium]
MSTRAYFVVSLLLLALVASGCYTVLKHPEGVALVDESQNRKNCMDCHQETWLYHYDPYWYGSYYPGDWRYYYGRPWWYDDYWYYTPSGETQPVEKGGRHMWSQPGLTAPANPGVTPSVREKTTPSQQESSGKDASSDASKDTKKKEEKETKRHMWTK